MLGRERIIGTMARALEEEPRVLAFWQGGSAAFGRSDEMSDLDLQLLVRDDFVGEAQILLERLLSSISRIEFKYILPQPTWHGYWQGFYRLKDTTPYLLLDVVIMKESDRELLSQPDIHGRPLIYFDRTGRVGKEMADLEQMKQAIVRRIDKARASSQMFHVFIDKEITRGRGLDALAMYQSLILSPLVDTLRIIHDPNRFNFGSRYLRECLPAREYTRVERLGFVGSIDELKGKKKEALRWLRHNLRSIGTKTFF